MSHAATMTTAGTGGLDDMLEQLARMVTSDTKPPHPAGSAAVDAVLLRST
jgi:predicted component of type VI protein secretion system